MTEYLDNQFNLDDPETVAVLDDLPLWSAPFGLMLLDKVKLKPRMTVLDIGFGAGFPLLELAQRLGDSSTVYGIDPWTAAHQRVKQKIKVFNIKNVKLVEGDAAAMEFEDNTFDLIVSNTGVNNFKDVPAVFRECYRVAKPGATIALTTNPKGHMDEFYEILEETIHQLKMPHITEKLDVHIDHRLTSETIFHLLHESGFAVSAVLHRSFTMSFATGSAFLNHSLIRIGFMDAWKALFPEEELNLVFTTLEKNLNAASEEQKGFNVTIPIAYIEGNKPRITETIQI